MGWDGLHEDIRSGFDWRSACAWISKQKLTKGHGGGEDDTGDDEGDSWVKV